jgi:DNA-binding response OmpR family regulator
MRAFRVLSLGYDSTLMPVRTMLLRQAGYHVVETESLEAALEEINSALIDLLLICHSVPSHDQDILIASVKSVKPTLPILCLTTGPLQSPPQGCVPAYSTAPEFLEDVNRVLPRHS